MRNQLLCKSSRQNGGVLVEFAVAAPIFFSIVFGSFELALLAYKAASLNYTLTKGSRWAILGETLPGQSRSGSIKSKIIEIGRGYGLEISPEDLFICPPENSFCSPTEESNFNGGGQNTYVQYSVRLPTRTLFGMINLQLDSTVLGRNEIFN